MGGRPAGDPGPLRAWRVLPLLAGLADLGLVVVHGRPANPGAQVLVYGPGFALIMIGLVLAGPWLTMAGARVMARRQPPWHADRRATAGR